MFHFLVAWNADFEENTIERHLEILGPGKVSEIDERRHVWWGKFRYRLDGDGNAVEDLEPFGETWAGDAAERIVRKANTQAMSHPLYLYIYNPNPFSSTLFIASVKRVEYTRGGIPVEAGSTRPACARMPAYYFHRKKESQCHKCELRNAKKDCRPKFSANFWFKIDRIEESPIAEPRYNLIYATELLRNRVNKTTKPKVSP